MKRTCPVPKCSVMIENTIELYNHLREIHLLPINPSTLDFQKVCLYQCHFCLNVFNKSAIGQHIHKTHPDISHQEISIFAKEYGLVKCPIGECRVLFTPSSFKKNKNAHLRTEIHRVSNRPTIQNMLN